MSELLTCVEVESFERTGASSSDRSGSSSGARAAVIWMHGLGADGHDFEPIVPELGLDPALAVRFVFPNARPIPVTINGGFVMPAWYDILSMELEHRHDEAGIQSSAREVEALVRRELERGVPAERIVLAGFSQGGAIAAHVALRFPERLAGLVLLSTYLVCENELETERSEANAALPVFQAHGLFDPMVVPDRGTAARDRLIELGHSVEWHTHPMQHEVCLEEIRALGVWLTARFSD